MSFTDDAWARIEPIRTRIEELPFVVALRDGSLERETFAYYMAQDALYLAEYGRALAAAAAQSTTGDDLVFWAEAARTTIVVERELHASHVADMAAAQPSPTCVAYTSYLLSLAGAGCYPALAAGVLPCFWIYEDVGSRILAGVADLEAHPYGDWIGAYGDPEFAEQTRAAKSIVDRLAAQADAGTRERMMTAFVRGSQFEWMFWDAAARREEWPVQPA